MQLAQIKTIFSLLLLCLAAVTATNERGTSTSVKVTLTYTNTHTFGQGFDQVDTYEAILVDSAGRQIGSEQGFGRVIIPNVTELFTIVTMLPGGSVVSIGLQHFATAATQPDIYSITGGTGIYALARGEYISQEINATTYTSDLEILF